MFIRKAAPYFLLAGLVCIVSSGLWVLNVYDDYDSYPYFSYMLLITGIVLSIVSFLLTAAVRRKPSLQKSEDKKDYMEWAWRSGEKYGKKLAGGILAALIIIACFDFNLAISLLSPLFVAGMSGVALIFILHDQDKGEKRQPKNTFLNMADYRKQPFSLSLILFLFYAASFLISKHCGIQLNVGMESGSEETLTVPQAVNYLAVLIFASGFTYIIHNTGFFGIPRSKKSDVLIMAIHAGELVFGGLSLLAWVFIWL
ncbi:hypothetical protein [Bacillus sp. MUM 13]|uniref:hypothetical protein n=1 Tax=Bacillus sp. MUM 13 TaxID=1678001 RepID=UPI0008F5940B|nr:hypothetical protein [Bacillus sp. MUM 13]OIK15072.1 hypothetical protein BIV59_01250 [Bacillus sp. MUM 13]